MSEHKIIGSIAETAEIAKFRRTFLITLVGNFWTGSCIMPWEILFRNYATKQNWRIKKNYCFKIYESFAFESRKENAKMTF